MKYCSECGYETTNRIPDGDNRERHVCDNCPTIHYQNPKNVCGCILAWDNKVLLCKRSIEPRYGYWTLPAGFMENNETTMEGAAREAFEEANATAVNLRLFGLYNLPRISQVYLMFQGAFPVVTESLQRYFEDRQNQLVHVADIKGRPNAKIEVTRY